MAITAAPNPPRLSPLSLPLTPRAIDLQDKESKLAYLDKILKYTCAALNADLPLKLGKVLLRKLPDPPPAALDPLCTRCGFQVVAGMEPERTNEFLQAVAEAATDPGVNRQAALAAVLGVSVPLPTPLAF